MAGTVPSPGPNLRTTPTNTNTSFRTHPRIGSDSITGDTGAGNSTIGARGPPVIARTGLRGVGIAGQAAAARIDRRHCGRKAFARAPPSVRRFAGNFQPGSPRTAVAGRFI